MTAGLLIICKKSSTTSEWVVHQLTAFPTRTPCKEARKEPDAGEVAGVALPCPLGSPELLQSGSTTHVQTQG